MSAPIPDATYGDLAACSICTRPACFQVRLDPPADDQPIPRRASACAGHPIEVLQMLRAWARVRQLGGGRLTVLAIDPHLRGASGGPDHGVPFYSTPVIWPDPVARRQQEPCHG